MGRGIGSLGPGEGAPQGAGNLPAMIQACGTATLNCDWAGRGLRLALHHVDVLAGQHRLAALVEQMQRNRRYPINYQGTSCWFNLVGLTSVRCLEGGLAIHGTVLNA